MPELLSHFDGYRDGRFDGWAYWPARPNVPVTVEISSNGTIVAYGLAADFRADLLAAGVGGGNCAFSLVHAIDPDLSDPVHVVVRAKGGAVLVGGDIQIGGSVALDAGAARGAISDETSTARSQQAELQIDGASDLLPWRARAGVSSVDQGGSAPPNAAPSGSSSVDGFLLGLQDAMETGWYNLAAGELTAGFTIRAEDVVVDVGCGDGGPAAFCARQGAHVILADVDAERLKGAKARLMETAARKIEAHVTNADPLPMPDACVTRVICMEVLEHVEDTAVLMAELVRVGQPGALYLITVPGDVQEHMQEHLAPPQYFKPPNHVRIITPDQFEAMVEDSGLIIERRFSYGFYWALWWMMFWQCDTSLESAANHPTLAAWAQTWSLVLKGRDGARIQHLLNELLPKNQVIVARKPL